MESKTHITVYGIAILFLSITAFALLFIPADVFAVDKPDFRVNDDGGSSEQNDPHITVTPDGGFIIVWVDKRAGDGRNDIYIQRFDSSGTPLSNNIKINDNDTAWQAVPSIASDVGGQFAVVWEDYRTEGYPFNPDIFYQALDSQATPAGGNVNITPVYPEARRESPDIAFTSWGTGIVVWADNRNGDWDIYGQMINHNGLPIGSNFRINDDIGTQPQHAPRVAVSSLGWFVVAWYDKRSGDDDIYVQRFDAEGTPLGANVLVNSDITSMRQTFPDIATDGSTHFTVVWVDYRNNSTYPDIWACKFDTNMITEEGNFRLTSDPGQTQRYPAIAADKMGNLAIIWSDETATSWNIVGQMIDVDGVVREIEFTANEYSDSMKIKPDVALNGSHRFITWVDRRNGNYDIYASISKYNDPGLVVQPTGLNFQMLQRNGVPAPQYVTIDYTGYNRLGFKAVTYDSWLTVSPSTGTTPDSVAIGIATDTLTSGTYFGNVLFIDTLNHDSTNYVSVRLEVISGMLHLSKDSIRINALAGMDTTFTEDIAITNEGVGVLHWAASTEASWVTLSTESGTAPSNISVSIATTSLPVGVYTAPVVIDAGNAFNSPDTVWVTVAVREDIPRISVEPSQLVLTAANPGTIDTFVVVNNTGGGVLNWHALPDDSWLLLSQYFGSDDDTFHITIDASSLTPGVWNTTILVIDSTTVNKSVHVPVTLEYLEDNIDTVTISTDTLNPGEKGVLGVDVTLHSQAVHIFLPLQYDTTAITVDSFLFSSDLPLYMSKFYQINVSEAMLTINLERNPPDMFMSAGDYHLGDLYVTAYVPGATVIDTLHRDTLYPFLTTYSGNERNVVVNQGTVVIEYGEEEDFMDTIRVSSADVAMGEQGAITVSASILSQAHEIYLPFGYDTSAIRIDSVVFGMSVPTFISKSVQINQITGQVLLDLQSVLPDTFFAVGEYPLAELHFTAQEQEGVTSLTVLNVTGMYPYIRTAAGNELQPVFQIEQFNVHTPTDVDDNTPVDLLPKQLVLYQNYPNPFNSTTIIQYDIPRLSQVVLEVFNVLGQKVSLLVSEKQSVGRYTVMWDGKTLHGQEAPSGIYFYRLQTGMSVKVGKMVILR